MTLRVPSDRYILCTAATQQNVLQTLNLSPFKKFPTPLLKMADHASIAKQLSSFKKKDIKPRIYHGSSNSTRQPHSRTGHFINICHLSNIVKIDKGAKLAHVQANVSMANLVAATIEEGLIPPVIPELPDITVGGLATQVALILLD